MSHATVISAAPRSRFSVEHRLVGSDDDVDDQIHIVWESQFSSAYLYIEGGGEKLVVRNKNKQKWQKTAVV